MVIKISLLYGVGNKDYRCHGELERRIYDLWLRMLRRCYSGEFPSYKECFVSDEWLVFSNFLQDIEKIPNYEQWRDNPGSFISLDKDINSRGNKCYCLENCSFVSFSDNAKEMIQRCGYIKLNQPKKVVCTDEFGNETIYDSLSSAEKDGFLKSPVSECCRGKRKQYKHHFFRFLS